MKRSLATLSGFVALAAIGLSAPRASARGDDVLVRPIVDCFHPAAKLVDVSFGPRATHDREADLSVLATYRYGDADYKMPFTFELKETADGQRWRALPDAAHDTGPGGPSAECALRDWQPVVR